MTSPNQGYLDPATSIKVGNILAAAGSVWQLPAPWEDPGTYFREGKGFGNPALLDQTAAMWQNLLNNQTQSSVNAIIYANNPIQDGSWTGAASQNYHQYLSEVYSIITGSNMIGGSANTTAAANMETSMQLMVDGLHAARDAAWSQWWAIIAIVAGAGASETGIGAAVGAALAIYKVIDAGNKDDIAGDDFDHATRKPLYVGNGPAYFWPEPAGAPGHGTFDTPPTQP
jgi:hypothetical protein